MVSLQQERKVVVGLREGGDRAFDCGVAWHGLGDASVAFVSKGWVALRPVGMVWRVAFLDFLFCYVVLFLQLCVDDW